MLRRLFALVAVAGLAPAAAGQQFDRRSRDEPEVVVEAGGRVGTCDVLRFTPDGNSLLAAGDDKVVRAWPYAAGRLDTDPGRATTLRWRAWREQRGGIKSVDVSPDGKRVVVGGYGMRPSTVAILDRETGDTLALTWPRSRPGIDSFNVVTAVAFDAAGTRVGFATLDGSLWVWDPVRLDKPDADGRPAVPPARIGRAAPPTDRPIDIPRLVHFRDANTLLAVFEWGRVVSAAIPEKPSTEPGDAPPAAPLFKVFDGLADEFRHAVYRAELTADRTRLVIGCRGPAVLFRTLDGKDATTIALPAQHFARSIAVHPTTGQLAVGVGSGAALAKGPGPHFFAEANDEIWLFDKPATGAAPARKLRHTGRAEALAFHPTENRLAVAGGDADEVTLLDLADPEKPASVVRGAGRQPWAVNLSANGSVVGIQAARDAGSTDPNRRGAGPWARFDLTRLRPTADESQPWVGPASTADGWSVVPGERRVWYAELSRPGQEPVRHRLTLDWARDQNPTCYTFIPAANGRPTRLLVGHYYGCTLFELTEKGAARTRLFTGHAGEVTSVVAAKDGDWFVSGGSDQTVAAWSLTDWKGQAALGAEFTLNADGAVEVAEVAAGAPGWEAGLVRGAVIDALAVNGTFVYDRRAGRKQLGTPEVALRELAAPQSGIELYFGIVPPKQRRYESLTTVRQRPLWKWFPAFDAAGRMTDWVIWTWHGSYYHTRTASGDRLVGWHVNAPDPGDRPQFYQLQQFEKVFHRPDVIEKLIATRDASATLAAARGPNPTRPSFAQYEPAPVRVALRQSVVGPNGVGLNVTARPRGTNPDLLPERVELWVNDHRLKVWKGDATQPVNEPFVIPPGAFRAGENRVVAVTFNPLGGRSEDAQVVRNAAAAPPPNLIGLAVGINDYAGHRKAVAGARGFGDLAAAKADARDFRDRLLSFAGPQRFFPAARVELRVDAAATRKTLTADLAALANGVKPDDLLVVFFAGHGDAPTGAKPTDPGSFVFCCPDYSPTKPADTAVSAEELFQALAAVNCRKVVFLDACRAGRATEANVVRRLVPDGQGPIVIASCGPGEDSFEDAKVGHGLFTEAVLDALGRDFGKADYNTDGEITPGELFDYVSARLPVLLRSTGRKPDAQVPIMFPRQPPRFAFVQK